MSALFLVGIDGSEGARRAAEFAARRARAEGGRLLLVHVVEWSGHEMLTPEQLAERHVEREHEIQQARERILAPVAAALEGVGVAVETLVRHGHVTEVLCALAKERGVTQVFSGRRGHSRIAALLFGSVAGSLVQVSPVPVTVVP